MSRRRRWHGALVGAAIAAALGWVGTAAALAIATILFDEASGPLVALPATLTFLAVGAIVFLPPALAVFALLWRLLEQDQPFSRRRAALAGAGVGFSIGMAITPVVGPLFIIVGALSGWAAIALTNHWLPVEACDQSGPVA